MKVKFNAGRSGEEILSESWVRGHWGSVPILNP